MSHIVLDPVMSERLKSQAEPTDLVDSSGFLLGRFTPATVSEYPTNWVPDLDRAGFEAALAGGAGVSTAELLTRLGRR